MVLGANDGIISTACLILGVAAADATGHAILVAGTAGLVAGAASMAIGEYVSVSSQRDSEQADIQKETWELENTPDRELAELTGIYQAKGLSHKLAREVAEELTAHDALSTHLAEELGICRIAWPWCWIGQVWWGPSSPSCSSNFTRWWRCDGLHDGDRQFVRGDSRVTKSGSAECLVVLVLGRCGLSESLKC